jgi:hypothetical protein
MAGEWQVERIGMFAEAKEGKRLPKGIALQKEKNNYPYMRVVDFADGKIQISSAYHVNNTLREYTIKLC